MDRTKKVTKKSYKGCEACRWQRLNGGTCKGGKARCGQFVAEKELIDANALDEEVRNFFLTIIGDPSQAMVVRECKRVRRILYRRTGKETVK